MGRHRRRRRARLRRFALSEGFEHPPLRGHADTSRGRTPGAPTSRAGLPADDVTNGHAYADRGAATAGTRHAPRSPGRPRLGACSDVRGRSAGPAEPIRTAPRTPATEALGELVKDLASQTSTLVRQEIKLAQAEVTQRGKLAGKGAGMLAGAAVTALLGLGAFTALLIIALDSFLPLWLAALIVTLLWLAVAAALGYVRQEGAAGRHASSAPNR